MFFKSTVTWHFEFFEPNTVFLAEKQSKDEKIQPYENLLQKIVIQKQIMTSLVKCINPFSLIKKSCNFVIMDKKLKTRKEDGIFDLLNDSGYQGKKGLADKKAQENANERYNLINKLDRYLTEGWKECQEIISSIKEQHHPQLFELLKKADATIQFMIVGDNPAAIENKDINPPRYYAIKYQDNSSELESRIKVNQDQIFQNGKQSLSKFVVFNKENKFYNLDIQFQFKRDQENHKMICELTVKDSGGLFQAALGNKFTEKMFKEHFEYRAHGDYIQIPFREPIAKRRKFMKQQSYSLAFQGGGAKGMAYVGAYKAIKEMKKNGEQVPITSIMGSSAGGIIALAVSTKIDPYEVQKICYKMGAIPIKDRIDRKYLRTLKKYSLQQEEIRQAGGNKNKQKELQDQKIDQAKQIMLTRVVNLLHQYGIIQKKMIDNLKNYIKKLDKSKFQIFYKDLIKFIEIFGGSVGRIFNFQEGEFQEINYLGLLLQGALMRGDAIHDIGSQCLVKYVLSQHQSFEAEAHKQALKATLSSELKSHVQKFDGTCDKVLKMKVSQILNQKQGFTKLFSIINQIFLVIDRNLEKIGQQKLVLNEAWAQKLHKHFILKEILKKKEILESGKQKTRISEKQETHIGEKKENKVEQIKGCQKLFKILSRHDKFSQYTGSDSQTQTDFSQREKRIQIIKQILLKDQQISYENVNQILAEEYFLNKLHFKLGDKCAELSLIELISQIFNLPSKVLHFSKEVKDKPEEQHYKQIRGFRRELAQITFQKLFIEILHENAEAIYHYHLLLQNFKKSVQKIDLTTYYKITKIELTCTSVDLDNKVLRFFNHKTTPYLPVCRAVQMTGSFPVGFKAQTWDKNWGKYYIYYDDCRREINLTGHEFTDGGMLANFPIKYFDNDSIRDCYFSHVVNYSKKGDVNPYETILYGFGLDLLTNERYTLSDLQVQRQYQLKSKVEKAKEQVIKSLCDLIGLEGMFSKINLIIKIIKILYGGDSHTESTIQWSQLPIKLINEIPILRFIFKLLEAYPKADRNLNLQSFKEKIYRTAIEKIEEPPITKLKKEANKHGIKPIQIQQSWFKKISLWKNQKPQLKAPSDTDQRILSLIKRTALNNVYFSNIQSLTKIMGQDQASKTLESKIKIKSVLLRIISSRMKLHLSQDDIQWHTLEFLSLKYSSDEKRKYDNYFFPQVQLTYQHFIDEKRKQRNHRFFSFGQKFSVSQQQQRVEYKEKLIEIRKQILYKKRKAVQQLFYQLKKVSYSYKDFALDQHETYLLQYIFLSKFGGEALRNAKKEVKKLSGQSLLRIQLQNQEKIIKYENKEEQDKKEKQVKQEIKNKKEIKYQSYITTQDLKIFYRRLFSTNKQISFIYFKKEHKLLSQQSLSEYQTQTLVNYDCKADEKSFNQIKNLPYLKERFIESQIQFQNLLLQKSFIRKLAFKRFIRRIKEDSELKSQIKTVFINFIDANKHALNLIIAEKLIGKTGYQFKESQFELFLNMQDVKETISNFLFDQTQLTADETRTYRHILAKKSYDNFLERKKQALQRIDSLIRQLAVKQERSAEVKSLKCQIYYLLDLQESINYQLLFSRIKNAKDIDYYLKNANIDVSMNSQETEEHNQKQKIKVQLQAQQKQRVKVFNEILKKTKIFQNDVYQLELLLKCAQIEIEEYCGRQIKRNPKFKADKLRQQIKIIGQMFLEARQELIKKLKKVISLPVGSISVKNIKQTYTLKQDSFQHICQAMFQAYKIVKQNNQDSNDPLEKDLDAILNYFGSNYILLPYFSRFWYVKHKHLRNDSYYKTMLNALNTQFTNNFISKFPQQNNHQKDQGKEKEQSTQTNEFNLVCGQISEDVHKLATDHIQREHQQAKKAQIDWKKKVRIAQELKIHFIMQGVDISNQYYTYYYQLFDKFKEKTKQQQQQYKEIKILTPYQIEKNVHLLKIRAITTSSYHSVFGFLLALNYNSNEIRTEMTQIRQIAQQSQPKRLVQEYFKSFKWISISSYEQKQFWRYIKDEKYNVFKELEKISNKSLPNHSLKQELKEVLSIYKNEQDKVMRYCQEILNTLSNEISQIDEKSSPKLKALQISKKYAFDYTCQFGKHHQYKSINKNSFQLYKVVVGKILQSYGSLLEGIITNFYSVQVKMRLPKFQSGQIYKGFIVKQLLSTYRLKDYVISKLKENSLRENITLSDFFNQAPNKLLLTFTTINIHEARLEFMNKNTMPNMPVWAAIISASCLPYFYRDFQCPREWQFAAKDTASLYKVIVDDYFKPDVIHYKSAKYMSGNIISSLPFQIITNQTTNSKMFTFEKEGEPYLYFGFAFDSDPKRYKNPTHVLNRKYLEVSILKGLKKWWSLKSQHKFVAHCQKDEHKTEQYECQAFSLTGAKLTDFSHQSHLQKYLGILTESNDNFTLHTYWNRLIRLPIKFGTLDFNEIINEDLEQAYGANVASSKAKDTIERSYQITKYFQREQFGKKQDRYKFNFRANIIEKKAQIHGQQIFCVKLYLLSHSKWNRNRYNNFLVQYSTNPLEFDSNPKTAVESQILWDLQQSSRIYLRFYFPQYPEEIPQSQLSSKQDYKRKYCMIKYTQFEFDLKKLISKLPLKDSYDYEFDFYSQYTNPETKDLQIDLQFSKHGQIKPFRKNFVPFSPVSEDENIWVRSWKNPNVHFDKPYFKPLR